MDEAFTTLVGWVAAKPYYTVTKNGYARLRGCKRRTTQATRRWWR